MAYARMKDSDLLRTARDRYRLVNEVETKQCERERNDIAFEDGDQWPEAARQTRLAQQPANGLPAVPARPMLVIDKVKEPVRQILNQERAADIGVEIVAADDFGDLGLTPNDDEILLREGLVRRIQRHSKAADARTWAYKRAVIAGRGYYIVRTRFLPGATWDQEVYVDRIYNQESVKLDPSHQQPDGSDADWEFIGLWVPWDRFKGEYPKDANGKKNDICGCSDEEFVGLTEQYPDWYQDENGQKAVRVVDYWYVEREARELAILADGTPAWEDELPDGVTAFDTRTIITRTIQFCKIAGGIVELERTEHPSPLMPIVKVIGDEVLPYDQERRYNGIIRPSRDAQVAFNVMCSKQVETLGLTPIPVVNLDPLSIEGYEEWWKVSNTRTLPYLPSNTWDGQGRQFSPPSRLPVDSNIYPIAQSVALFDQAIKSTTAVPDSTLGNVDPSLKSGKAIREVVQNAQLSTSNFLDNLLRAIRYEGEIINSLLYPIYGTKPGRLVRILTGEGDSQTMAIGQPSDPAIQAKAQKVATLTKDAQFNVIVKIAKSTENRRQQFVELFGSLLGADPAQMMIGGDLFYKNMDIPEARELAKRQRVMLAPPIQALLAQEETGQPFDPKAQAQIGQLQQQLQQLQQIAQQQAQEIQTKKADNDTKLQIEQLRAQVDAQKVQFEANKELELQRMKDATTIRVAEIAAQTKGVITNHELAHEAQALGADHAHDAAMEASRQSHEQDLAAQQVAAQQQQQAQQQAQEAANATTQGE